MGIRAVLYGGPVAGREYEVDGPVIVVEESPEPWIGTYSPDAQILPRQHRYVRAAMPCGCDGTRCGHAVPYVWQG